MMLLNSSQCKGKTCGIKVQTGSCEVNHKAKGVPLTRLVVYTKDCDCGSLFHQFLLQQDDVCGIAKS